MNIEALQREYAAGTRTPVQVVEEIYGRIGSEGLRPVWISVVAKELVLARVAELAARSQEERAKLPLYGVPFAVKDNIDVAGMETTAACPAFAYVPVKSATVVEKLEAAGAVLIGKTNMDQFATGLVGTRTPHGACSSVFSAEHISGGSSSGSAVAVASGLVSFALGTDTAGSGRVPAMFNNLIGLKPTRGVISTQGVVPACRTLDCVSIFAETAGDAALVLAAASGFDAEDAYSRQPDVGTGSAPWAGAASFRFGVPVALEFFGDAQNPRLFSGAIEALKALGGEPVEFDLAPFLAVARLLYQGPWVAERFAAIAKFYGGHSGEMDPVVSGIIGGAAKYTAVDVFEAVYRLEELRRETAGAWQQFDVMLLPTAPRAYTHAEVAAEPVRLNSNLGYYTNFVNLLDLAAVAVPAGMGGGSPQLPFGVSLIGPAFTEEALLGLADRLQRALNTTLGGSVRGLAETAAMMKSPVPAGCLLMAVVGAHLSGQPLNWQLTQRGGRLVRVCKTSAEYRLYALANSVPMKPGLVREPGFEGPGIAVEVWALPSETVGSFVEGVPQPLGIGKAKLEDGTQVMGFIAEPAATLGAVEITHFGGWRAYLKSLAT